MSSYDAAIIDTEIIEHPALLALPRTVRLLHIEAIVWSRLHYTDGRIPALSLRRLTDEPDHLDAAQQLVDAGLWTSCAGGWSINGFLDKQMSAERVRKHRERAKDRWDRWQEGPNGRKRNGVANGAANETVPAQPDPTRPDKGGGEGGLVASDPGSSEPVAAPAFRQCAGCGRDFLGDGYSTTDTPICSRKCQQLLSRSVAV